MFAADPSIVDSAADRRRASYRRARLVRLEGVGGDATARRQVVTVVAGPPAHRLRVDLTLERDEEEAALVELDVRPNRPPTVRLARVGDLAVPCGAGQGHTR